jgi:para-aminobenzoate synthetase component 1
MTVFPGPAGRSLYRTWLQITPPILCEHPSMISHLPEAVCGTVGVVHMERLATQVNDQMFLDRVRGLANEPYSAVLLSGGDLDCSRYSLAAWDPLLVFKSKGDSIHLQAGQNEWVLNGDPLNYLDTVFESLRPSYPLVLPPFCGGALGYFAYDLKNCIERLPQTAHDDHNLPDILLFFPQQLLIHDRVAGTLHHVVLETRTKIPLNPPLEKGDLGFASQKEDLSFASQKEAGNISPLSKGGQGGFGCGVTLADGVSQRAPDGPRNAGAHALPSVSPAQAGECGSARIKAGPLASNFTHDDYLEAVRRVRHYIREGDVYQVNLSQRFRFNFEGQPFALWEHLYALNPAPFYAFIQAGDHQILSTSMERFLLRQGSMIETRPIKGTRKRGQTPAEDEGLRRDLQHSPKDDAELSMIVDLLRNDLGRICRPRSVRVTEHKRLESYQNVHHLISIVTGQVREGLSHGEMLRATFPGGSITGCPKVRAMEIIDELEPHVRHVYTGAIGYLGWHGNADLNIAIRTALVHQGDCYFSVGGGIVHDSDEEDEYQETLHKARTLFDLIERLEKKSDR